MKLHLFVPKFQAVAPTPVLDRLVRFFLTAGCLDLPPADPGFSCPTFLQELQVCSLKRCEFRGCSSIVSLRGIWGDLIVLLGGVLLFVEFSRLDIPFQFVICNKRSRLNVSWISYGMVCRRCSFSCSLRSWYWALSN